MPILQSVPKHTTKRGDKIRVCYDAAHNPHQATLSRPAFKVLHRVKKTRALWAAGTMDLPIGPIRSWIKVRA